MIFNSTTTISRAKADSMTALVCERYGSPDVLRFSELPKPSPKPGDVLIRVKASTITSADRRISSLDMPTGFGTLGRLALGWHGPRNSVLGATFAGVVQAVGARAKGFKPGDSVFGISGLRMGGHAQYLCVSSKSAIAHKPDSMSDEVAASIAFGGGTALYFLHRAGLASGHQILVVGASGNVGSAAVQLAHMMGAEVTGVCSAAHLDTVRQLGAAHVIDYAHTDFTAQRPLYDIVFDTVCNLPVERCLATLKPGGVVVRLAAGLPEICWAMLPLSRKGRRVIVGTAHERADYLNQLAQWHQQGLYSPVISRVFPFREAIDAHRYADRPSQGAGVVITM